MCNVMFDFFRAFFFSNVPAFELERDAPGGMNDAAILLKSIFDTFFSAGN